MKRYYLAIDIGASSGKAYSRAYGRWENGSRGNLPFPEWNDRKKRDSLLGCRASVYRNRKTD